MGEKLFGFETTDNIVDYSSNDALHDVKYIYAHGIESIYFTLYRKYVQLEEHNTLTQKDEYVYSQKKTPMK